MDPWVVEVLREGYRIPFLRPPPLYADPIPMPLYAPTSIKGAALEEFTLALIAKGVVELAPLRSPGFYSRLFVVWKTSGSWRPVIDRSLLNRFVDVSHFRMETIQSVLLSVRQGDWMASIDLREAYLQVPVHPESRRFLRFVAHSRTYQFKALCFGLSTAPQVFTRVMAPVSAILHSLGIRMRRYLDDWLVQASSREALLRDLGIVLSLCHELGIVINPKKSNFCPSQVVRYLRVVIDARNFMASPSPDCISRLRSTSGEFLCSAALPASLWQLLLGMLSSVTSGSRGPPADEIAPDLPSPLLGSVGSFGSGAVVSGLSSGPSVVASRGSPLSRCVSPSGVPRSGLLVRRFRRRLGGSLGRQGCFRPLGPVGGSSSSQCQGVAGGASRSPPLPVLSVRDHGVLRQCRHGRLSAQGGGHPVSCSQHHWAGISSDSTGSAVYSGGPQCSRGLSLPSSPAPSSEWSLDMDIFRSLTRQWPGMIDLFATSDNHRCSIYFSPYRDPLSAVTDALLQS